MLADISTHLHSKRTVFEKHCACSAAREAHRTVNFAGEQKTSAQSKDYVELMTRELMQTAMLDGSRFLKQAHCKSVKGVAIMSRMNFLLSAQIAVQSRFRRPFAPPLPQQRCAGGRRA